MKPRNPQTHWLLVAAIIVATAYIPIVRAGDQIRLPSESSESSPTAPSATATTPTRPQIPLEIRRTEPYAQSLQHEAERLQDVSQWLSETCNPPMEDDDQLRASILRELRAIMAKGDLPLPKTKALAKDSPSIRAALEKADVAAELSKLRDSGSTGATLQTDPGLKGLNEYIDELLTAEKARRGEQTEETSALCDTLCKGPKTTVVNLCAFRDAVLANAAIIADFPSVRGLEEHVGPFIVKAKPPDWQVEETARWKEFVRTKESGALTSGLTTFSTQLATVALEGLAKLIAERAKYETAAWALDRVGKDLCGRSEPLGTELTEYWTKNLCQLSSGDQLWYYGAGTATLSAVRSAVEADVKSWPGHAAGLAVAEVLRVDTWSSKPLTCKRKTATPDDTPQPVDCTKRLPMTDRCAEPKDAVCDALPWLKEAVSGIRTATATRLTSILEGASAPVALHELGLDLAQLNRAKWGDAAAKPLYSWRLALMACAATLPEAFASYRGNMALASEEEKTRATVLAGLTASNACFALVGKGKDLQGCLDDKEKCKNEYTMFNTNAQSSGIERLSTILRLSKHIAPRTRDFEQGGRVLQAAISRYEKAAEGAQKAMLDWDKVKLPTLDASALGKGESAADVLQKYLDGVVSAYELAAIRQYLTASLDVAQASVSLSQSTLDTLTAFGASTAELAPGFCHAFSDTCKKSPPDPGPARDTLAGISRSLGTMRNIAANDWSRAVMDGLTLLQDATSKDPKLARAGATLVSILSARNGKEMAVALDAVASPPGGWRRKQAEKARMLSITAFPGFFVGVEWRDGRYLKEEDWTLHRQMPALAFPVGLDLDFGYGETSLGLFGSVLDPAGFLQYDADGRLPGTSLRTALMPGLGFRVTPCESPFTVMLLAAYRPGFRQAEADVNGTGANAYQLGLLLGVDVTLLELDTSQATSE